MNKELSNIEDEMSELYHSAVIKGFRQCDNIEKRYTILEKKMEDIHAKDNLRKSLNKQ